MLGCMGLFKRANPKDQPQATEVTARLLQVVERHLPGADRTTVRIVAALAGLLAAVGYADRNFSEPELRQVRKTLARIEGLGRDGEEAIIQVMHGWAAEASEIYMHHFARELHALTDRETRLEVLDMLLDLAAADGTITFAETTYLRQVTASLGLSLPDYNASQQRHRDKLSVLR